MLKPIPPKGEGLKPGKWKLTQELSDLAEMTRLQEIEKCAQELCDHSEIPMLTEDLEEAASQLGHAQEAVAMEGIEFEEPV